MKKLTQCGHLQNFEHSKNAFLNCFKSFKLYWGARKLTGENLKLVWAEFLTIS
jgi:hypothetical protein